jgi:hypothetical protein
MKQRLTSSLISEFILSYACVRPILICTYHPSVQHFFLKKTAYISISELQIHALCTGYIGSNSQYEVETQKVSCEANQIISDVKCSEQTMQQ